MPNIINFGGNSSNKELEAIISGTQAVGNSLNLNGLSADQYAKSADLTKVINGTTTVTKATQDASGNVITSTYVNLTGTQTISGAKTFSGNNTFSGNAVMKTGTDYTTARARNIILQSTVPTSIPNGTIVGVYE